MSSQREPIDVTGGWSMNLSQQPVRSEIDIDAGPQRMKSAMVMLKSGVFSS